MRGLIELGLLKIKWWYDLPQAVTGQLPGSCLSRWQAYLQRQGCLRECAGRHAAHA